VRRVNYISFVFIALGAFLSAAPAARATQSRDTAEVANVAYEAKDWLKSAALYKEVVDAKPQNGRAWFRLGVSLRNLGQPEKALQAFDKAAAAGAPNFLVQYQSALALATLHEDEKALSMLKEAVTNGFSQVDDLQSAPEFASFRSDARFSKLIDQANRNLNPCAYAAENRQFDFWVGEWKVVNSQDGMTAGSSRIEKILNDCVILENWTSANAPYQGKSYNTFNTSLKRWEQFWVDNSQGMIHFKGELKDGVMDYWTDEMPQPDGKKLKRHLQFIPQGPDKVRQFSQGTYDKGANWFVEYDLTYLRQK